MSESSAQSEAAAAGAPAPSAAALQHAGRSGAEVPLPRSTVEWLVVAALLACIPLLAWRGIRENSVTIDEFAHVPAGYSYWRTGDFSIYARNPPLIKLFETLPWLATAPAWDDAWLRRAQNRGAWAPWALGDSFLRGNRAGYQSYFEQTRWMTVLLAVSGGALVWWWARQMFGRGAALLALAAYVYSPTVLAHGSVATTDVGAMVLFALAIYSLWKYVQRPSAVRMLLAGAALGLALAAKFTAILLLFALPLVMLILLGRAAAQADEEAPFWRIARPYVLPLVVMPAVALLVINAAYGFRGTALRPFAGHFESSAVQTLGRLAGVIPVPLPLDYVRGFDEQQHDIEHDDIAFFYLNGRTAPDGWWYYFPAAFALKEPIGLVALAVLALLALPVRLRADFAGMACLLVPLAVTLIFMLFFNRLNIGVRYLLPIYPILCVLIGRLVLVAARLGRGRHSAVAALGAAVLAQAAAVLWQGPDYLSFFSEAVGGGGAGRRYLLDSNLDWGQDLLRLARDDRYGANRARPPVYLAYFGHVDPALVGIRFEPPPERPAAGTWIVSANFLAGMGYPMTYVNVGERKIEDCVRWLRDQPPTAMIGRSLLVFEVSETPR